MPFNKGHKKRTEKEENIGKFSNLNVIIVICISVIDQGTGPIKLFMLSIVLKVFIDYLVFKSSLLIFTQALSWLLFKLLEGTFIFGDTDKNKAYQMF